MKHDIEAARLILEKMSYLDGRESIGSCRADLIEAHRLLCEGMENFHALASASLRVRNLYGSGYIRGYGDGGRCAHAFKQLSEVFQ